MDCLRTLISRKFPCTQKFSGLNPPLCTPPETVKHGKKIPQNPPISKYGDQELQTPDQAEVWTSFSVLLSVLLSKKEKP